MVNPFPLARGRRGRPNAHHNPMEPFRGRAGGLYRPRAPRRIPRQIPDERFDELFAAARARTGTGRWSRSGSRPGRGRRSCWAPGRRRRPGQQLITVIRKGTRALQQLPASPDAFVWLRLYQAQMHGLVRPGAMSRCGGRCGARSGR